MFITVALFITFYLITFNSNNNNANNNGIYYIFIFTIYCHLLHFVFYLLLQFNTAFIGVAQQLHYHKWYFHLLLFIPFISAATCK